MVVNFELESTNFITKIVDEDVGAGKPIITRFPPEPNGYLHIGHAKSLHLNFGIKKRYGGKCNVRFDDTNPTPNYQIYADAILEDIRWLGCDWEGRLYYASDYFDELCEYAVTLINKQLAYVDDTSWEKMQEERGSIDTVGVNSIYRDRSIEENLDLFMKMKDGKFKEKECCLRAKIDMSHPNMNMRDPVLYRIKFVPHPRTGDKWCIYPTYDFAHGQCDSIERISHSLCTVEFELHRPLYDWFQENIGIYLTRQIEFSRLNVTYLLTSKRKLLILVENGTVSSWDDPRMPTLSGMRRKGYPAEALHLFCDFVGLSKRETTMEYWQLESHIRSYLDKNSLRKMGILEPLLVRITDMEGEEEYDLVVDNHPVNATLGQRKLKITNEIYIEQSDFQREPTADFQRLILNGIVKLRYGFPIRCDEIKMGPDGKIQELLCSRLPKDTEIPKSVKTIHWVTKKYSKPVTWKIYSKLFTHPDPDGLLDPSDPSKGKRDFLTVLNPESLVEKVGYVEESVNNSEEIAYQFERVGYFFPDSDSTQNNLIFNKTVSLSDNVSGSNNDHRRDKELEKLKRQEAQEKRRLRKQKNDTN